MNKHRKVVFGVLALLVGIVVISISYAAFTQNLNINGTANVTASNWSVHFENLSNPVKNGSARLVTPATIKTGKTIIGDYSVEFYTPGDSLQYTFDIVNEGDFDAYISNLTKGTPSCSGSDSTSNTNVCNNLSYTLTYVSSGYGYDVGDNVSEGDTLAKGETRRVRMLLKYNSNMTASQLPTADVTVSNLEITIQYAQGSNYGGNPTLQETEIAKFLSGEEFNIKIKQLANPNASDITRSYKDENIINIQRSNTLSITPTSDNKVSSNDSDIDIYAWFNNGTLYYYSTADKLYMNENAEHMFQRFISLDSFSMNDIDTSKVTSMYYLFAGDLSLEVINLSNFNTSNVENMSGMFYANTSLLSLDLSNFDTSKVTDMSIMFYCATSLTTLDLSSFDTSKVTNMMDMFSGHSDYGMMSLTSINLSSFDTTNVETMEDMFRNCQALRTLDLSSFRTPNLQNMSRMFYNCASLTTLDLSMFDTADVTTLHSIFQKCSSLKTLDLSSFNTSNVTDMFQIFVKTDSIETIYVGNSWDISANTSDTTNAFAASCNLRNFSASNTNYRDLSYANTGPTGYLTLKSN